VSRTKYIPVSFPLIRNNFSTTAFATPVEGWVILTERAARPHLSVIEWAVVVIIILGTHGTVVSNLIQNYH
jgi:hypothetical protein